MTETAASALAVLRTRLPYVDRRSLSEAWFSALHLAAGERARAGPRLPSAPTVAGCMPATFAKPLGSQAVGSTAPGTAKRYVAIVRSTTMSGARPEAVAAPRDAAKTVVARAVPRHVRNGRGSSLTVGIGTSRVQLVWRREGPVLHIVALCRRDIVDVVRRALADADFHVRSHGANDVVRATVRALEDGASRP